MKNQGFSLVEMIVVMALLLVSGTVVMSVFNVQNSSTLQLTTQGKMHYLSEVVLEEIERNVRPAVELIGSGAPSTTVDTLFIKDGAGDTISGYANVDDTLFEFVDDSWIPFVSGGETVLLMSNSGFELSSGKEVVVQLQYMLLDRGDTVTIPPRGGLVRCRN